MSTTTATTVAIAVHIVVFLLGIQRCEPSSTKEPHFHSGKVVPFSPGDPKVQLDDEALHTLDSGKPHQTRMERTSGGRGLVVQDVHAPDSMVWERILDYDNYSTMVPNTVESENYHVRSHRPTRANNYLERTIYTRMKVGLSPLFTLELFLKHSYHPGIHSLVWTLDYGKKSDFDDSCGYWYVIPHPNKNPDEWTRLFYSVEISMFDWIPKFIVRFMNSKALTDATSWVKTYSEAKFDETTKKNSDTASSTNDDGDESGDGGPSKRRKKLEEDVIWPLGMGKQKREALAKKEASEAEARNEETNGLRSEGQKKEETVLTWTRMLMVSFVSILASYSVYLFFSR